MKAQKTKQASEATLIKIVVNLKCLGFPGRCLRSFTAKEKNEIFDEIIRRGWVDDNLHPLPAAADIIRQNLALCER